MKKKTNSQIPTIYKSCYSLDTIEFYGKMKFVDFIERDIKSIENGIHEHSWNVFHMIII